MRYERNHLGVHSLKTSLAHLAGQLWNLSTISNAVIETTSYAVESPTGA
jgi:hypothetical protein